VKVQNFQNLSWSPGTEHWPRVHGSSKHFLTFIATHFEAKPNTVVMFLAALQIQP